MHRTLLTIAFVAASTAAASAHDWNSSATEDIDARRANQLRRIEQGRRGGDLTWREYWYLRREQAQIAAHERRAARDGYISRWERQQLYNELAQADRDIYRLRHNGSTAWWRRW